MSLIPYKFGYLSDLSQETPFTYSNDWALQETTGPKRIIIAPASGHVNLMQHLSEFMPEPFYLLYVLLVSRNGNPAGRYQVPKPILRAEMKSFLNHYVDYFERDGRHHIWVGSETDSTLLVYDNHNVIYAYGGEGQFERELSFQGFRQAERVSFPVPHTHCYNEEFDSEEQAILRFYEWKVFPLQENDDI